MPPQPAIDLDRRFVPLFAEDMTAERMETLGRGHYGAKDWSELLKLSRVVILAEAGSGKSTELLAKSNSIRKQGRFAFYATVKDTGSIGFAAALGPDAATFDTWLSSGETAWLFVDSVDEAMLEGVDLRRAMLNVASSISGHERRARVVISGRYTDWDYSADLETVSRILPGRHAQAPLPSDDVDIVRRVLNNEKPPALPQEPIVEVFLMAELDENRIRHYAEARSRANPGPFISAIQASNLWRFARRPLDLSWMVDFWDSRGRLGTLAEMMDECLTARSRESNRVHGRTDPLSPERCRRALERIGAAMVFCRSPSIALKSSSLERAAGALDLETVLPDWSAQDVARLLRRPVFDPATFGRSRLHNDNNGEVRAYLAAQWLKHLLANNCTSADVREVLLAEVYGHRLVRPSASSAAAWLALDSPDISKELIQRNPSILVAEGDPGSLTLPQRVAVLEALTRLVEAEPRQWFHFQADSLRRFATAEIAAAVRIEWTKYGKLGGARMLLLQIIWRGRLSACLDLAVEASADEELPDIPRILAGHAVVDLGDPSTVSRLAQRVRDGIEAMPPDVAWAAAGDLFPKFLSVPDLFRIFDRMPKNPTSGREHRVEDFVERIDSADDLHSLVVGLVARSDVPDVRDRSYIERRSVENAMVIGATRLLEKLPGDKLPLAAVDVYFEMRRRLAHGLPDDGKDESLGKELCRTQARRRNLFWYALKTLSGTGPFREMPITHPDQMAYLGWPNRLEVEDAAWLLSDLTERTDADERLLALSAAHAIWRDNGQEPHLLESVQAAIRGDQRLEECLEHWLSPPGPSADYLELAERIRLNRESREEERADREASWRKFIADMKESAPSLAVLPAPVGATVDSRLYDLWKLALAAGGNNMRYAIRDAAPLERLFGTALGEAFAKALSTFWRAWTPTLRSGRPVAERNQLSGIDCMALGAVSLEANTKPCWARSLQEWEAEAAVRLATIELNGFPPFLEELALAQPEAVAKVLGDEIGKELDEAERAISGAIYLLNRIPHAAGAVVRALRPRLLAEHEMRPLLPTQALEKLLESVLQLGEDREKLAEPPASELLQRASRAVNIRTEALYIAGAFAVDPAAAVEHLESRRNGMGIQDRARLMTVLLPELVRSCFGRLPTDSIEMPVELLERLTVMAIDDIKLEDDGPRTSDEVRTTTERDAAESARNALFNRLAETAGQASYDALLRFMRLDALAGHRDYLRDLAMRRAEADADGLPWTPGDVKDFEETGERRPSSAADLQRLLTRRFDDIQHALLNDDFYQGPVFKELQSEKDVQLWVADRLRLLQRDSYGVEREPHRFDEKEPDIVVRAKLSDVSVPVEIKVAEDWSLQDLLTALHEQLCGRYLRETKGKHGILLLAHKVGRPDGWRDINSSRFLSFGEVVDLLKSEAEKIARGGSNSPQPTVSVLDVSTLPAQMERKASRRATTGRKARARQRA